MVKVVVIQEFGSETTVAVSGSDRDIIGATVHRELNAASSAVLVFPPENPLSGILDTKNPVVAVYDGETQMFVGSVAGDISTDIWGRKTINLDGALSWLKNVCKPPFTVSNRTVEDYVSTIISQYNAGVAQNRRVTVGGITVPGYVTFNHNDEFTTIGELVAETVQTHGGYLSETFRGRGLTPRIDYFATSLTEDSRPLVFGRDIEEFESVVNYDGYCSRVYAVGKDGITATAVNTSAEKQFGRVDYPLRSDAETVADLQAEADAVLAARSVPVKTVTAKALAASGCIPGLVKKTVDYRRMIELSMMVYAVDIDLLDPSKNRAEFGLAPKKTFTSTHGRTATSRGAKITIGTTPGQAVTPVTVWEIADVTQGLIALNTNISSSLAWQLTGLNLSPFKRIKVYAKAGRKTGAMAADSSIVPAVIIEMLLDDRAKETVSQNVFIGSSVVQNPNDPNRLGMLTCAVSGDKTKFAVVRATSLYGTAATSNTDCYQYVFKIEGYYD